MTRISRRSGDWPGCAWAPASEHPGRRAATSSAMQQGFPHSAPSRTADGPAHYCANRRGDYLRRRSAASRVSPSQSVRGMTAGTSTALPSPSADHAGSPAQPSTPADPFSSPAPVLLPARKATEGERGAHRITPLVPSSSASDRGSVEPARGAPRGIARAERAAVARWRRDWDALWEGGPDGAIVPVRRRAMWSLATRGWGILPQAEVWASGGLLEGVYCLSQRCRGVI